jgi:hypothetical protein
LFSGTNEQMLRYRYDNDIVGDCMVSGNKNDGMGWDGNNSKEVGPAMQID